MSEAHGEGGTARSLALTHINQNREAILRGLSLPMHGGALTRISGLYLKVAGTDINLCGFVGHSTVLGN